MNVSFRTFSVECREQFPTYAKRPASNTCQPDSAAEFRENKNNVCSRCSRGPLKTRFSRCEENLETLDQVEGHSLLTNKEHFSLVLTVSPTMLTLNSFEDRNRIFLPLSSHEYYTRNIILPQLYRQHKYSEYEQVHNNCV